MVGQFDEYGLEEAVKQLVLSKMICFGPNSATGTNILVAHNIKNRSFVERVNTNTFEHEET